MKTKLWKLTCCDKSTNAPISWTHYYYGSFQDVTHEIEREYSVIFLLEASLNFNSRLWTLRQVHNFSHVKEPTCESLQTNIMD